MADPTEAVTNGHQEASDELLEEVGGRLAVTVGRRRLGG